MHLALLALSWTPYYTLPARPPRITRQSMIRVTAGDSFANDAAPPSVPPPTTPAQEAMLLQLVSHTAVMEDMMRQSAADVEEMPGVEERLEAGRPVIRREDMVQSASVMLENSGLADIPGAHAAASSLQRIATIAQADQGQLRTSEYLAIADAYSAVRVDCQRLLEAMPRQQQDESKQRVAPSSFSMKADATPEPVPEPIGAANAIAGLVWVGLVAWSFTAAPGPFPDPIGPQLVATLAAQPVPRPESINELFYAVFNSFSVVAASIAALTLPSGGKLEAEKLQAAPTALASWIPAGQRVPAIPFLWGSVVIGYFALGPYFALRSARPGPPEDAGWCTRNIFEQRAFGVVLSALTLSLPFSSGLLAPGLDYVAVVAAFGDLLSSSRFVAVASVDIVLMLVLAATLIKEDCARRGWAHRGLALGAGSLLLPILGPCLYLAVRPPLDDTPTPLER